MKSSFEPLSRAIDAQKGEMVKTLSEMIAIKAVSTKSGGEGETARADFLEAILNKWGLKVKRYTYKDDVSVKRTSLVSKLGNRERTIWIIGHIDTVAEGDRSLWKTDPFKASVVGDRIYGRGANDDGQSVVSGMYALKVLKESGLEPKYNYGLVLAANEEEGSKFGMQMLMKEKLFGKGDMFIVPDWGKPDGSAIEIGEKGLLWLKLTVTGKQAHASAPADGVNAFRYMIRFLGQVDERLHKKYTKRNPLFGPDYSTFEMTKHEKNVDSTNILPGKDVAYIDCRVLPDYKLDEVLSDVKEIAAKEEFRQVKIEIDIVNREDPAPLTDKDSQIVKMLSEALVDLHGIDAKLVGIGGGTCAAFPRKAGMQAAVWSTIEEIAHQPNEFAKISDMVSDAKILAYIFV